MMTEEQKVHLIEKYTSQGWKILEDSDYRISFSILQDEEHD